MTCFSFYKNVINRQKGAGCTFMNKLRHEEILVNLHVDRPHKTHFLINYTNELSLCAMCVYGLQLRSREDRLQLPEDPKWICSKTHKRRERKAL